MKCKVGKLLLHTCFQGVRSPMSWGTAEQDQLIPALLGTPSID